MNVYQILNDSKRIMYHIIQ